MGKSRTTITQPFKVRIDLVDFMDTIKDKLNAAIKNSDRDIKDVFLEDWELDGEYVEFDGSYRVGAETWYYKQTMEEPEESGYEPDTSLNERDIVLEFKEQISKLIISDLLNIDMVDDDFEPEFDEEEDYGPDPDRAYDEWKDREWEER